VSLQDLEKEWQLLDVRALAVSDELELKQYRLEQLEQQLYREQSAVITYGDTYKYLKTQSKVVILSEYRLVKHKFQLALDTAAMLQIEIVSLKDIIAEIELHLADVKKALLSVQNKLDSYSNVIHFEQRTNQVPG